MDKFTDQVVKEWLDVLGRNPPSIDHGLTKVALIMALREVQVTRAGMQDLRVNLAQWIRNAFMATFGQHDNESIQDADWNALLVDMTNMLHKRVFGDP